MFSLNFYSMVFLDGKMNLIHIKSGSMQFQNCIFTSDAQLIQGVSHFFRLSGFAQLSLRVGIFLSIPLNGKKSMIERFYSDGNFVVIDPGEIQAQFRWIEGSYADSTIRFGLFNGMTTWREVILSNYLMLNETLLIVGGSLNLLNCQVR